MNAPGGHLLAKIGQYAIITNNYKQILLLQRVNSGDWSLPGGRLNKDDKNWQTAIAREVSEETGLTISDPKPFEIKLIEDPFQIKYCVYFTTNCSDLSNIKLSGEHKTFRWIDKDGLSKLEVEDMPFVRQVLEKYFDNNYS